MQSPEHNFLMSDRLLVVQKLIWENL